MRATSTYPERAQRYLPVPCEVPSQGTGLAAWDAA
jgi:hypothetical protein